MIKNLNLFGRIVVVGIFAAFVNLFIMQQICSNCGMLNVVIFIFGFIPALVIGFIAFSLIQRTGLAKFVTSRNVNIFGVILAALIIIPSVITYVNTVPPSYVVNDWYCDEGQDICEEIDSMDLMYGSRYGYFYAFNGSYLTGHDYIWKYDTSSKEITLTQSDINTIMDVPKPGGWEIILRLDVTDDKDCHKMTTHYISSSGDTPFNAELFDGVTWTAA